MGTLSGHCWALALDTPANVGFHREYERRFGRAPDLFALRGYDAGRAIIDTVNRLQGNLIDRSRLVEFMAATRFESPRGPFRFDPDGWSPVQTVYVSDVKQHCGRLTNVLLDRIPGVRDPARLPEAG